jgi:hypothetical protein
VGFHSAHRQHSQRGAIGTRRVARSRAQVAGRMLQVAGEVLVRACRQHPLARTHLARSLSLSLSLSLSAGARQSGARLHGPLLYLQPRWCGRPERCHGDDQVPLQSRRVGQMTFPRAVLVSGPMHAAAKWGSHWKRIARDSAAREGQRRGCWLAARTGAVGVRNPGGVHWRCCSAGASGIRGNAEPCAVVPAALLS